MSIDCEIKNLIAEVVKTIRAARSQESLSRKSGFSVDQISRWETARTAPDWKSFAHFCDVSKAPLSKALKNSMGFEGDPQDAVLLIHHLKESWSLVDLADFIGISRQKVGHWLAGRSLPGTDEIFRILDRGDRLVPFLDTLLEGKVLPSIEERKEKFKRRAALLLERPHLFMLHFLLGLRKDEYPSAEEAVRHLADLGIPQALAREGIEVLLENDFLQQTEHGLQRTHLEWETPRNELAVVLARYFANLHSQALRIDLGVDRQLFTSRCFSVSRPAVAKMKDAIKRCISELQHITATDDEPCETVKVLSLGFFDLEHFVHHGGNLEPEGS